MQIVYIYGAPIGGFAVHSVLSRHCPGDDAVRHRDQAARAPGRDCRDLPGQKPASQVRKLTGSAMVLISDGNSEYVVRSCRKKPRLFEKDCSRSNKMQCLVSILL